VHDLARHDAELQFRDAVNRQHWDDATRTLALIGDDSQPTAAQFLVSRAELAFHVGDAGAALAALSRANEVLGLERGHPNLRLRCARLADGLELPDVAALFRRSALEALRRLPTLRWTGLITLLAHEDRQAEWLWLMQETEKQFENDVHVLKSLAA